MQSGKQNKRSKYRSNKRSNKKRTEHADSGAKSARSAAADARLSSLNDVSWYTKYPDLVEPTARIAYPYRPGMLFQGTGVGADNYLFTDNGVPGVMTLSWVPSIGQCAAETDPANQLSRELFSRVRAAFSGSIEAEGADMTIQVLALSSIFSYIGSLKRTYRVLDSYSPNNYVLPNMLLRAMGFADQSIANLRANKANFAFVINALVRATEKFKLPAVFDVINRHYWLNDNVYTDDASINSQFYVFNQVGFYQFAVDANAAGQLVMQRAPWEHNTNITVENLYSFGMDMIDALSAWDDCFIINGYFQRAFEGQPEFVATPLEIDAQFVPVYVPEVLTQIENSKSVFNGYYALVPNIAGTTISQDPATGLLSYRPAVAVKYTGIGGLTTSSVPTREILSIRSDAPTVADNLIATRMMNMLGDSVTVTDGTTQVSGRSIICATEIMLGYQIRTPARTGRGELLAYSSYNSFDPTSRASGIDSVPNRWRGIFAASFFDWMPISWAIYTHPEDISNTTAVPYGDLHNVTLIAADTLRDIHRVCTYSEFNAFSIR